MKKLGTRFFSPETVTELENIIDKEDVITLLAGGTSLFRTINGDNLIHPGAITILENIPDLKKENRTERYFDFGSMLTIEQIINSSKRNIPKILLEALQSVGPYPIRNVATIGGTVANSKIIADIIPLLLIFDCKVEVISFNTKKKKPKWESLAQYIQTKKDRGLHLITRVRVPLLSPSNFQYYKTGFQYNIFSEISFSAIAEIEKDSISSLSMAFNINNRLIVRPKEIEAELIGKRVPLSFRLRDTLCTTIRSILAKNSDLEEHQIYSMSQIILHFLESFN
ncbi:MAG: FAD binding domain-containing protein [Spirochaetaceae bacterium]